ncbi:MAG: hypothetical protein WBH87_06985, partial [Acetivibrionales bacterium]
MTNIIGDIRDQIRSVVRKAMAAATEKGLLPDISVDEIIVEAPKEKEHGDFSTNIAMLIVKKARKAPVQIASILIDNMDFTDTY